jgi:predicted Zn-dependent peptidase
MRSAALAAIALAAGSARGSEFEFESFKASRAHPRIVLAKRPGATATMLVSFGAGSVEDESTPGLARVCQHALLEANQRGSYEALVTQAFAAGAHLAIETGLHEATFALTADRRDFAPLAELLATMTLAPRIDPRRFPVAVERALQDESEPGKGANLLALLTSTVLADWRYQNLPYGDRSLEGISQEIVEEHLQGPMSPGNAVVVVAGNFDRDRMLRFLRRFSGGGPRPPERPRFDLPLNARFAAGRETHLLAYPFVVATPAQAAAARVLASAMEERLVQRFRGAGVGYSLRVWQVHTAWLDLLLLVLPAHDPSELDLGPVFREVVEEVREGRLPPDLFERNRQHALRRLRATDRNPTELAEELAGGAGPWYGPSTAEALRTLSRDAFVASAAAWLAPSSSIYVLFTPKEAAKPPGRGGSR